MISTLAAALSMTAMASLIVAINVFFWNNPLLGLPKKVYGIACMMCLTATIGAVLLAVLSRLN